MTSSESQLSIESDVHENIDLDETEQSLLEVHALKKHISIFENEISQSSRLFTKREEEHARCLLKIEGGKIYEQNIEELNSLRDKIDGFLNFMAIGLQKLSSMEEEIENTR